VNDPSPLRRGPALRYPRLRTNENERVVAFFRSSPFSFISHKEEEEKRMKETLLQLKNRVRLCTVVVLLLVGAIVVTISSTFCINRRTQFFDPKTIELRQPQQSASSKSYIWTQVSGENDYGNYLEQGNNDNDPLLFNHCRPGQCRYMDFSIDESTSLWKLAEEEEDGDGKTMREVHLSNLTNVLDYFPNHILQQQEEGHPIQKSCTIFFVGDSLSSDHAMAAACQLLNAGYSLKSMNLTNLFYLSGDGRYGSDLNTKTGEVDMYPGVDHILLEKSNSEVSSCSKVLLMYTWPRHAIRILDSEVLTSVRDDGGIIVFNLGVHCNEPNTNCIGGGLNGFLLPIVKGETAKKYLSWRVLFRETEPQHFNTPGGAFDMAIFQKGHTVCGPMISSESDTRWRNQEAADYLQSQNLTSRVKTITIYDQLVPLHQLHHFKDCTHYCYDPYRFDVTWDGMLQALTSYDEFASSPNLAQHDQTST